MATGRQIVSDGKYFLYRHIRLDKNEPFYIGVGTKQPGKNPYIRAFRKELKNNIWWKIANKSEYEVEILLESNDYEFILNKEIEFISLYGRINLGNGHLSNITNGGRSLNGYKHRERSKTKISKNHRSRGRFGKDNEKSEILYQYSLEGIFVSKHIGIREVSRKFNVSPSSISSCLRNKSKSSAGFQWLKIYSGEKIEPIKRSINIFAGVEMLDVETEKVLREFKTTCEATKYVGKNCNSEIVNCCNNKQKTCHGYKWRYKK
jgi:hypothetical protein